MSKFQPGLRLNLATCDFDELATLAAGWDHRYDLIQHGRFFGRNRVAQTPRVQFSSSDFGLGTEALGTAPSGAITVVIATYAAGLNLNGVQLDHNQLMLSCGGAEHDLVMPSATSLLVASFDEAVLREQLEELCPGLQSHPLSGVLSCGLRSPDRLRRIWQNISAVAHDPQFDLCDERLASSLEDNLRDAILMEVQAPTVASKIAGRRRVAHKARRLIQEQVDRPISLSEVCIVLGTTLRTLELGFRESFGISPKAYQLMMRLNAARRQLLTAGEAETVASIAVRWGFFHFGRFSQQYRRAFGELPSVTLRRPKRSEGPRSSSC